MARPRLHPPRPQGRARRPPRPGQGGAGGPVRNRSARRKRIGGTAQARRSIAGPAASAGPAAAGRVPGDGGAARNVTRLPWHSGHRCGRCSQETGNGSNRTFCDRRAERSGRSHGRKCLEAGGPLGPVGCGGRAAWGCPVRARRLRRDADRCARGGAWRIGRDPVPPPGRARDRGELHTPPGPRHAAAGRQSPREGRLPPPPCRGEGSRGNRCRARWGARRGDARPQAALARAPTGAGTRARVLPGA